MCVRATDICLFAMHFDHINLPIAVCFFTRWTQSWSSLHSLNIHEGILSDQ